MDARRQIAQRTERVDWRLTDWITPPPGSDQLSIERLRDDGKAADNGFSGRPGANSGSG
ncbi:hypothetical protein OCAR_4296 [Afipia carboxidovorans OM5]|nr:hypothetical protein OCAR_4296 [Afipia carboxidovorans OM5]